MKKIFPRLLALLLVITMLPITALATLDNHNKRDIDIVSSTDENNYYFPDIIMHPDGTLLVCYYRNTMHVGESTGTIYMAESTDNGYTWSDPWEVVNYPGCDSRDPNLAVLPDGTVILTWFYGSGGDRDGTCMKMSADKGRTWGEDIQLESDILDESMGKRGNIVAINNENILIPCYGISSGINAYGAPATSTERGLWSTYHRDAVILHYQKDEDGVWSLVNESLLGQDIDETGVMYTGKGIMGEDGISFDGDVYTLSREDGSVRVSHDSANTWEVIAKEEPRQYVYANGSIIMSAEQIIQPRMWKITDDAWFVTYANYNNLNYAYDRLSRPVYGKIFFPEAGWYATQAKLIFDQADVQDMADPATVLTAEGRLLTIYYHTGNKTISGTFSDLEEWANLEADSLQNVDVERYFWSGGLTSYSAAESTFKLSLDDWTWAEPGASVTGFGPSFTSKETISGNYSVQFDFKVGGTSGEAVGSTDDRDEGLYLFPLYESTNENIEAGMKYRVRLSATHGVSLHYGTNANGDYGDVIAGLSGTTNVGEHTLPSSLERNVLYTGKIAKIGDGLFVKVWKNGESEPGWQCEYHDETIDVEGAENQWKFHGYFVNNNYDKDTENGYLSNMQFNQLVEEEWDLSNAFRADNVAQTNEFAKLNFFEDGNGFDITNANMTYFQLADVIGGDYELKLDFTFEKNFPYRQSAPYYQDNGLCLQPQYVNNNGNRLMLTPSHGLEIGVGGGASYGGYFASMYTGTNQPTSFAVGTPYTLAISKANGVMKVKAAPASQNIDNVDWQYEITENVEMKEWAFDFRFVDKTNDGSKSITVDNISYYGKRQKEVPFWENMFSNKEDTEEAFDFTEPNRWDWPAGGIEVTSKYKEYPDFTSKNTIEGDYTGQFDFTLTGVSTDDATTDRDEGIYVLPFSVSGTPFNDAESQYRIRLSSSEGAQVTYATNTAGDFVGVIGGVRGLGKDTLPSSLERNVPYTIKFEKAGDTLNVKVFKASEDEPEGWQFSYSDPSIDVAEPYKFIVMYLNKGTTGSGDTESALFSNAKFFQWVEKTEVSNVKMQEDYRWFFWDSDVTDKASVENVFTVGGPWTYGSEGMTAAKRAEILSDEVISGHYTAEMNFVLNGSNGLAVHPLYESTNANNTKDYRIKLTAGNGVQLFYETEDFGGSGGEMPESYTDIRNEKLEVGTEYTLKVMKAYDQLAAKVWAVGTEEPLGWDIMWQDKSVGYATRYLDGSWGYPYDHSMYGETDKSGKPYHWNFKVSTIMEDASSVTVSDLKFYKDIDLDINHTEVVVNEGETALNVELNAMVYPNIYAQLPKPATPVQYSSVDGLVELNPIHHDPGVRINRATITGLTAGEDVIEMRMPGLIDDEGEEVVIRSNVTVNPANPSAEFKTEADGYLTEVIYQQDFEEMAVNENIIRNKFVTTESRADFDVVDTEFNPMSDFFEYRPFYAMGYQAVLQDDMYGKNEHGATVLIQEDNKYLQGYVGSGSQHASVRLRSNERIAGDFTFQADVYLGSSSSELRVDVVAQRDWAKPTGEACYALVSALSSYEKIFYTDYEFGFRQWYSRIRLNAATGINLYDETEMASGWQTVKAVKAGNTVYFKSWPKGGLEPDWEVIKVDDRLVATEDKFGGSYVTIEMISQYTDKDLHGGLEGSIYMDNILITRKVKADAEMFNVNLVTNGGTIKEGKEVVSYIEGNGATLPTEKEITRTDYTFGGWYDNIGFAGEPVTEITTEDTGDKTFYAMWLDNLPGTPSDDPAPVVPETPEEPEQPEDPEIPEVPEVTGTITHASRSLSLEGSVLINQYVYIDGFEGINLEDKGGMLFFKDEVTEETATVENAYFQHSGLVYDAEKDRYGQQSYGIAAKEYGDTIYIRPYVEDNNGNYHYGDVMTYSVREYAEGRLEKSSNQKLKDTCIAMLHYGAAAQTYYGYNTDNLANAGIAEQYPNFAWDASLLDEAASFTTNIPASKNVVVKNKSLSLEGAIEINFYTTVSNIDVENVDLLLWKGVEGELTLENAVMVTNAVLGEDGRYAATSMEYAAKEYGETVFACAKVTDTDGNEHYSEIVPYSPEVYAAGRLEKSSDANLKELVKAMTIYGEKARVYFG